MKLLLRQKFFSWFDSYDIYYEDGSVAFQVKGELSWGHLLRIYDGMGNSLATVREKIITFLPQFEIFCGDDYLGNIHKELTFFRPKFYFDFNSGIIRYGGSGDASLCHDYSCVCILLLASEKNG